MKCNPVDQLGCEIHFEYKLGASLQLAMVVDDTEFSAVKMIAWKIRGRGVN